MDIAVCKINLKTGSLDFAGANRPLWVVKNKTLLEFKPDKFPIGGLQFSQVDKYSLNQLQLSKEDTIYLTTDGFADQFGGKFGKKLMTKKFKELILTIQHLKMHEQEEYLSKYFNEWKNDREQIDDVLIIGLKF